MAENENVRRSGIAVLINRSDLVLNRGPFEFPIVFGNFGFEPIDPWLPGLPRAFRNESGDI